MISRIFPRFALSAVLLVSTSAHAATLLTSTHQASSHSQKGKSEVFARAADLTVTNPGHSKNLRLGGSDLSEISTDKNRNGNDTVSASSSYVVQFAVEEGETATLTFDFSYSIKQSATSSDGTISWNLTGPDSLPISAISGMADSSGIHVDIDRQTVQLSEGTYTFTLTGDIPQKTFMGNHKGSRKITFDELELDLVSSLALQPVPEPSTVFCGAIGVLFGLGRRRR
jgi:hypothetical protein